MSNWYLSTGGQIKGPYTTDQAKTFVRENHGAHCWQEGFPDWRPVHEVMEIWTFKKDGKTPFPKPPEQMMSPKPSSLPFSDTGQELPDNSSTESTLHRQKTIPMQNSLTGVTPPAPSSVSTTPPYPGSQDHGQKMVDQNRSRGFGTDQFTEGIDYKIYGHEMQYVEVELDPGESAVAEAGALMYKDEGIDMETIFGDGSSGKQQGLMGRLLGAGQRLLTGESLFMTVFTQNRQGKGRVAFAAPFPGTIIPLDLSNYQNKIICQKDSFLAGTKGIQIGIHFQKRILTGLFGGEGFIMQKIEGDGWVFMHVGGAVQEIDLAPGEILHVDTGCLAAITSDVDFDIMQAGGIKTMLFGGEGLFFAKITGPGKIWLQSLPFSRLAGRMLACAPGKGTKRQGEGSILGSLGDLAGGR